MKQKYVIIILLVFIAIIGALGFYLAIRNDNIAPSATPKYEGSVERKVISAECNGKDIVCVVEEGKVVAKDAAAFVDPSNPECEGKECNLIYAGNVSAAVEAIRTHTGIPNLDLTPLIADGTPRYVTYFCNEETSKCWAVDHRDHTVVDL